MVGFGSFEAFLFFFTQLKKKSHNLLPLMLDPIFKSMCLVMMYVGHDNVVALVVEYDNELLLPLLMEVCKPSMPFICNQNS